MGCGTRYFYQVVAVNSSGASGFSPEANASTPGAHPDPARYNFETDAQRWAASGNEISGVATSNVQAYSGSRSLAVNFDGSTAGTSGLALSDVVVPAESTITFHVWIPAGSAVTTVNLYQQDYNWNWSGSNFFYLL